MKHINCDKHFIQKCGFCHTCIKWQSFEATLKCLDEEIEKKFPVIK